MNCKKMMLDLSEEEKILQVLLRELRKEAGLSQQELANLLKRPQSFVSKYESGERRLDILELREICQQFNIDLIFFVKRLEKVLADKNATKS